MCITPLFSLWAMSSDQRSLEGYKKMRTFSNFVLTKLRVCIIILVLSGIVGCTFIINNGDNANVFLRKQTEVDGNEVKAKIPLIP